MWNIGLSFNYLVYDYKIFITCMKKDLKFLWLTIKQDNAHPNLLFTLMRVTLKSGAAESNIPR